MPNVSKLQFVKCAKGSWSILYYKGIVIKSLSLVCTSGNSFTNKNAVFKADIRISECKQT